MRFIPLLALPLVSAAPVALAQSASAVISDVTNATVYLNVTFEDPQNPQNICSVDEQGTGFIVSPQGGMLTAAHILRNDTCSAAGFTKARVEGRIGYLAAPSVPVTIATIVPEADVAALRLGPRGQDYAMLTPCLIDVPRTGTDLLAFGFAHGQDLTSLPAIFQGTNNVDGRWRVSSQLTYGMSGGPVTDKQGRVLAMVKSGIPGADAIQTVTPIAWAMPALATAGVFDADVCPDQLQAEEDEPVVLVEPARYDVRVMIEAMAPERKLVSKTFPYDFGNQLNSCDEGWTQSERLACLPDNAEITRVDGPRVLSAANDGRSWYGSDPDPACVVLHYGYSDRGPDLEGNCRGDGWISAEWTLEGIADGAMARRKDEFQERVRVSSATSQTVFFTPETGLLDGLNSGRASWSYRLWVHDDSDAVIAMLDDDRESSGKFSSSQDRTNGTVTLTIAP